MGLLVVPRRRLCRSIPPGLLGLGFGRDGGYGYGGAGGSSFSSPSDITGLLYWFDANDLATLFQDSGLTTPVAANSDPVGGWTNKGSGQDLVQATAGARPLYKTGIQNGKAAVLGDGTDDFMALTHARGTAQTIYVVAKAVAVNAGEGLWSGFPIYTIRAAAVGGDFIVDTEGFGAEKPFSATVTNTNLYVVRAAAQNSAAIALNGGAFGAAFDPLDLNSAGEIRLFRDPFANYLNAYVMEIVEYDSALSAGDDTSVRAYLNTKWAIY